MSFVCWRTEDLDSVLNLEALSGKEELFLATHFPLERLYIRKNNTELQGVYCNQEELFNALARERLHMFCVIEGIAGCGKSHLIRWLAVQWRKHAAHKDVVLLLPRSGHNPGRLIGVLRDELTKFGFENLASQLIASDDLTSEGRRESFLDRLATLLDSKNVQQKRTQWEWCDQKRISDALRSTKVREQWEAPARLIADHQKEELPLFRKEEVWQLVILALHGSDLKAPTRAALMKIKSEADKSEDFPETERLLSALNDRSRPALRAALGLNERIISEVFSELRRHLYRKGQRLVVLQEDITAAKAIDETLLDLFVSPAGMEGVQECPLVAVCGITPEYEEKYFNQTYGNRVTLHIDMSRFGETEEEVPLSIVGTGDRRRRFVARYLNGVRWSAEELREQWDQKDAPPSKCIACEYRDTCHRTFGAADGYGLYPFTGLAIERGYEYLADRDDAGLAKTPRNVLLGLMRPSLMLKKQIEQNRFPGPEVQSDRMRPGVLDLFPDVDSQIRHVAPGEYPRMRALIGLWGDGGATQTQTIGAESFFAGVGKSVYTWFGLPWLGEGTIPTKETPKPPASEPAPPMHAPVVTTELDKRLAELTSWRKGEVIQSQTWWEDQVWQIVSKISWIDHGTSEWAGKLLLTRERIKLEGNKAGEYFLVIPFEEWAKEGLQALVHFKLAPVDFVRYGNKYLIFVENVKRMALQLVRQRMASWKNDSGGTWNPLRTAIECLAIHAWVSGKATPLDPLEQQWQEVLSFPTVPEPLPSGREDAWIQLCKGNIGPLQTVHKFLDSFTVLLQGEKGKFSMEDASGPAGILASFVDSLELSRQPKEDALGNLSDLVALSAASQFTASHWRSLISHESQRIEEHVTVINERLEKTTLRQTAKEVQGTLDEASRVFPAVAAHEVIQWAQLYGQLSKETWWNDNTFEDALQKWSDSAGKNSAEKLTRCIRTPADQFDRVMSMLNYGDTALTELEIKAKSLLKGDQVDPSQVVADIHKEGQQVGQRAQTLKDAITKS
jgi:hypothetical protein